MMDEYIPSPRHTPNKPRRMRDVSSIYPVNEKQLLLEAIMKQQRESPSCGEVAAPNGDPPAIAEDSDVDVPPLRPPSPASLWREKRTCPVCHWTEGSSSSSSSSSSGTSEYDGYESDVSSVCKDCKSPCVLVGEASSSSSEDDDEDDEDNEAVETKEDSLEDGAVQDDEEEADEDEDSVVKSEVEDTQRGLKTTTTPTTTYFGEQGYDSIRKGVRLHKALDRGHCLLGREVLTAPGKLLYGRHSVYYRETALFQPQGRN